jgi:hypothetical protein
VPVVDIPYFCTYHFQHLDFRVACVDTELIKIRLDIIFVIYYFCHFIFLPQYGQNLKLFSEGPSAKNENKLSHDVSHAPVISSYFHLHKSFKVFSFLPGARPGCVN